MKFGNFGAKPMNAQRVPKAPKVSGKKLFSSRTVIGVICIVLALLITFGVAPLVNRFADQKVDIVRLKANVERGQVIEAADIEIVNVGSYNLPSDVMKDGKAVVGKYAATDLYAGDYLFANKLSTDNKSVKDVLLGLGGDKIAISVTIGSFAEGLSNKLENGDIVSLIVFDKEANMSYIPAELKYVKVITATTNDGIDKDQAAEGSKSETVTVLVTPAQAEKLAYYNATTSIHFTLVYRGNAEKANAYIKVQDEYIKNNPVVNVPENDAEADNG